MSSCQINTSDAFEFTNHAIARWRERTGCRKSDECIKQRLAARLVKRRHIKGDQWYASGFVFAISGNTVITVMHPSELYMQARVYEAHNKSGS